MMENLNFYVSSAVLLSLAFSLMVYIFSPKKEEQKEDSEKINKYAKDFPGAVRNLYRFLGGWLLWLSNIIISIVPMGKNPTKISLIGMLLSVLSAISIAVELISIGGVLIILGGIMDILDGKTARKYRIESGSGAFADSVLDRVGEIAVFSSILIHFLRMGEKAPAAITSFALGFSMLVSYIRSRGESLGVTSEEGIMRRHERIFLISSGLLLDSLLSPFVTMSLFIQIAITLIMIGSLYTSFERFRATYHKLKDKDKIYIHNINSSTTDGAETKNNLKEGKDKRTKP